jgi:hypothetical protein
MDQSSILSAYTVSPLYDYEQRGEKFTSKFAALTYPYLDTGTGQDDFRAARLLPVTPAALDIAMPTILAAVIISAGMTFGAPRPTSK